MDAPESDTVLSSDIDFNISNEPFYHIVTFDNVNTDDDGVTRRYEHILKIARRSAECEYTMNVYEQIIDTYEEDTTKVIGTTHNENNEKVNVTKTFHTGDEIVLHYAKYISDYIEDLHYIDSNHEVQTLALLHKFDDIVFDYAKYDHTEYDEEGTVVHAKGDVMLDDNNKLIYNYIPTEKQFHWNLVNSITDTTPNNTIKEPLD